MISIDPATPSDRDNYRLLIGAGLYPADRFSYYTVGGRGAQCCAFQLMKDTSRNAIHSGAFVIHITDESIINMVNETAANLAPYESEVTMAGFTPVASDNIAMIMPG